MIIIDSLLAAPLRGLMFVLEKIDEAVREEAEAEERTIMADLSALHRALDSGAITEAEFDGREQKLLDRLDHLRSDGSKRCRRRLSPVARPAASARPYRDDLSLAEALDRILHRGVSLEGNLTIGLADVDLLFLDLRLLLGSVDTIWPDGRPEVPAVRPRTPSPSSTSSPPPSASPPAPTRQAESRDVALGSGGSPPVDASERQGAAGSSTAQGLVRLVLTLVKLLHDVLERQAVRRMEAGRLTDAQIDNLGTALFAQADEILRLQRQFGFSEKDLSLDLGVPDGAL